MRRQEGSSFRKTHKFNGDKQAFLMYNYKKSCFTEGAILLKNIIYAIKKSSRRRLGDKGSFLLISTAPLVILQLVYSLCLFFSLGEYERLCRWDDISFSLENVALCLLISLLGAFLCDAAEKRAEKEKNGR